MQGQGNYSSQGGQGSYLPPPPAFQHGPAAIPGPPPRPHYSGMHSQQPQGPPSFHIAPGNLAYPHAPPGPPHPAPLQNLSWSQNMHQGYAQTSIPTPSGYLMPSSRGYSAEQVPAHHTSTQHAPLPPPPPRPPPYPSNSNFSAPGPFESSVPEQSSFPSMGPTPPPPPLPSSSPPGVPPLPCSPASESSAGHRLNQEIRDNNYVILERPPMMKLVDDKGVPRTEVPKKSTELDQSEVKTAAAVFTHSQDDSDMDMEDDITQPDEEVKQNFFSNDVNAECVSLSQEVDAKGQLQASQCTGTDRPAQVSLDGNLPFAASSAMKDLKGSEVPSDCHIPKDVHTDGDSIIASGDTEHRNFNQCNVPMASAEAGKEKLPGEVIGSANPFNLLQGYTSENSSENEGKDLHFSPESIKVESRQFDSKECNVGSEYRPGISDSESSKHKPSKSMDRLRNVMETDKMSSAIWKDEKFPDECNRDQDTTCNDSCAAAQPRGSLRNDDADNGLAGINLQNPDAMENSPKRNVDEFGRLIREGGSDSDANGSPQYTRRHARVSRKRSRSPSKSRSPHDRRRRGPSRSRSPHDRRRRSPSRSHSPHDRRRRSPSRSRSPHDRRRRSPSRSRSPYSRRRRSPRMRKERRGRSRSFSPKRQRSRSRSPVLKRGSEYFGDRGRRDRSQRPECFDFRRGKCYRGATCKFSHHESNKSERLRYNRGLEKSGNVASTRVSPDFTEEMKVIPRKKFDYESKEVKDKGFRQPPDMPGLNEVNNSGGPVGVPIVRSLNLSESIPLHIADIVPSSSSGYSAHDEPSRSNNVLLLEVPTKCPDKVTGAAEEQPKNMEDSLVSDSTVFQSSAITLTKHDTDMNPVGQSHLVGTPTLKPHSGEEVPSDSLSSRELSSTAANHPYQLPYPLASISQVHSASVAPRDFHVMPPLVPFHFQLGHYPPYQASVSYQHSHIPDPSNLSSGSFLPASRSPNTYSNVNVPTGECNNLPQHMQESVQPPQSDSSNYVAFRNYATEFPNPSQGGPYQAYPSALEPEQTQNTIVDFRSRNLNASNSNNQQVGHHKTGDHVTGHPQSLNPLHSLAQTNPDSFRGQPPLKINLVSPGESLPPHTHPYSQQASYQLQSSGADGFSAQLGEPGKVSSMSGVPLDVEKLPSNVHEFLQSRIPNHLNPYASTFGQPIGTKFISNALTQENNTSKNTIVSSGLAAESVLPKSGGDQYDPLFDSIEPVSNSFSRNETTGDSDNIRRFNGSGKMLNRVEIMQERGAAISANSSAEIEEYGETADVEAGAVLNGSPNNVNDETDMNAGEFEIDQVKSSGKKKDKDSRSMKLFKVSIASFVKAVLKPSWRQGNMSKEAFKTIVKKTVDKVSGAMKSHQIPKSQAKINHYIDSSRGKLTKLVMGYVDKYVKV